MTPANDEANFDGTAMTGFLGWDDAGRPPDDDPAETFHEASKNVPSVLAGSTAAARMLESDPVTQAMVTRPVKRHSALPAIALPAPVYSPAPLGEVILARRSRRDFGSEPISLQDLATVLHAAYGVTGETSGTEPSTKLRTVPSGGALYPLEIYPLVREMDGLEAGVYHYDPLEHALEAVRTGDVTDPLHETLIQLPDLPDLAASCSVVLFVTAVFWRTRFKYGLRGYRWALIEAGHLGQNAILAAESQGLAAVPYGGIWDRRVDELLGLDGVNESVVYSLVAGSSFS